MGSPEPGARTTLELVRVAAGYLAGKGVAGARLDAEVLLAHVLSVPRIQLYLQFDKPLEESELAAYRDAVRRRAAREPVAYITGRREFWSLDLEVGAGVLVPRPETEILVAACLERLGDAAAFVDVGVGSGAAALALLSERPGWRGVGVDRSPAALETAARNAGRLGLGARLQLCQGDLLGPVAGQRFDLVLSNPPYIPSADIEGLEPEVRVYEPREALDGGPDGIGVIRRLAAQAAAHLVPGGWLALEFGADQATAVGGALGATGLYAPAAFVEDYAGRPRVALAQVA